VEQPSTTPEPEPSIGPVLRELRRQRGLSLQQVALATGISKSFLSLVENGTSDITFGRLRRLIDLYGVELSDLVPPHTSADDIVVRATDREVLYSPAPGIDVYLATPDTHRGLLVGVVELAGGSVMPTESQHPGEEWLHVISGAIEIRFAEGATVLRLGAGDSAYLPTGRAHRVGNPFDAPAQVISALTQGHSRNQLQMP
jgi:transcriptional regulator with XRE-family HTH domain